MRRPGIPKLGSQKTYQRLGTQGIRDGRILRGLTSDQGRA